MRRSRNLAGVFVAAGAVAVGLGVASAAPAAAGPAGTDAEVDFLLQLQDRGMNIDGGELEAVKLGYLLCALDQIGGTPPDGTAIVVRAARNNLCDAMPPVQRGPSLADVQQQIQDSNSRMNEMWLDTDADDDGISDGSDDFDYDDGVY
jgi:hypothetical protein